MTQFPTFPLLDEKGDGKGGCLGLLTDPGEWLLQGVSCPEGLPHRHAPALPSL